jgi:multiple sugar transport system permease protein
MRPRTQYGLAYLCLAPSALLMLAVIFYPIIATFALSVCRVARTGAIEGYAGLANFARFLGDPLFWRVMKQTGVWTVSCVAITIVISLYVAALLNEKIPLRGLARGIVLLPWATSLTISSVVWRWILNREHGMLNQVLLSLHVIDEPIGWLARPETSFPAIIGIGVWVSIPFTSIVLLAGMQSIPDDLYEAALIDGAGAWQRFRSVTLPLLRPVLLVVTLLNVIYVFNSFPIIWTLTRGDPANRTDTLVTYLYKVAFDFQDYGPASGMAVLTFVVLLTFSVLYTKRYYRQGVLQE